MKKLIALSLALFASTALAVAPTYSATTGSNVKGVCASGSCDAPTTQLDGLPLAGGLFGGTVKGVSITVCADSGQTLSGAGTLTAYTYDPATTLWAANPDMNLTVSASGLRCQSFAGFSLAMAVGRAAWVPTSVTVSSGGVTVYMTGN